MRYPSIKTIETRLQVTRAVAKEIREAMERGKGLVVANRLLGGFGQESIGLPEGCFDRCETPDVDIKYVNLGDTYKTTVLKVNGAYKVGSWGDESGAVSGQDS